jgi:hypothetical protein
VNTEIGCEYRNRLLDGPHGTVRNCVCDIVRSPALPSAVPEDPEPQCTLGTTNDTGQSLRLRGHGRACAAIPSRHTGLPGGRRRAPLPGLLCSAALRPATGGKLKPRVPYRVLHGTSAQKPTGAAPRRATPPGTANT